MKFNKKEEMISNIIKQNIKIILLLNLLNIACVPPSTSDYYSSKQFSNFTTLEQFYEYFDTTKNLDPIEGLWNEANSRIWTRQGVGPISFNEHLNNFKYAIIRKNNSANEFQKVYITSRTCAYCQFSEITTSLTIIKTSENTYRVKSSNFGWERIIEIEDGKKMVWDYDYVEAGIWFRFNTFYEKDYPYTIEKLPEKTTSTGTGFILSTSGFVLTNFHVIDNADSIFINSSLSEKLLEASAIIKDKQNDISLLRISNYEILQFIEELEQPIRFANSVKVGQEVFTIGYPLGNIMGDNPRASFGRVNSLYGILDDPRLLQISNPIQPGNSGGPLFNMAGELVGIVVSGLNAKFFYDNLGIIPQNVNFAIKNDYLKPLLNNIDIYPEDRIPLNSGDTINVEKQIDLFTPYIVQIIAR